MTEQAHTLKKHKVTTTTVFFMIFCMVCAGAYGIEDMIPTSGPGLTLLLLVVLPFFWSIPQGLVAAELGSAIPEEGGYYKWIQRALGEFWGFQACWWRTVSIYVDSTLYVILSVGYISSIFPLDSWQEFALKVFFILAFTYVNILGLQSVGRIASYFSIIVIGSFIALIFVGAANFQYNPVTPFIPEGQGLLESIGLGIAICMWMYAGYESMSTMAGEMENPQVIPKATILSVPAIMLLYILSTAACLGAVGNWQSWGVEDGISFGSVAHLLGHPILGFVFVITAVIANLSMYNTYLASGSRGFFSLADDNLSPRFLKKIHPKHKTPYIAVISMAVINLILCQFGFDTLVVIDVFLLMFAYILIYIAAIVLRIKEPELKRPFRIPLGIKGLTILCISPIVLAVIALFTNGLDYFIGGCLGAISGPVAYIICKKVYGGVDGSKRILSKDKKSMIILCGVMIIFMAGGLILF
ncbi:MAG: APC family permease [Bacillota bacterium]|nr:APC family permease [Bacillota bacterium]